MSSTKIILGKEQLAKSRIGAVWHLPLLFRSTSHAQPRRLLARHARRLVTAQFSHVVRKRQRLQVGRGREVGLALILAILATIVSTVGFVRRPRHQRSQARMGALVGHVLTAVVGGFAPPNPPIPVSQPRARQCVMLLPLRHCPLMAL